MGTGQLVMGTGQLVMGTGQLVMGAGRLVMGAGRLVIGNVGVVYGLLAAFLFAASTPLAKTLLGAVPPLMLAALLYCGSGLGLFLLAIARRLSYPSQAPEHFIKRSELVWLGLALLCGGILAPVAMMQGLSLSQASSSSMLLNLEGVFTAALAWIAFKENVDRRIFLGMAFILAGGCILSFTPALTLASTSTFSPGSLFIVLACLFWALDNNFCRKVESSDSVLVAMTKGLGAGGINLLLAFYCGQHLPPTALCVQALTLGFLSYGLSLVCYLTAQRYLGTARTGAYFASAPFIGAILAIVFLHESLNINLTLASALMLTGLWLHLTENHSHYHVHEEMEHSHSHTHDQHHDHVHKDADFDPSEPHVHLHKHKYLVHSHRHFPDSHHHHNH